ncbi:MAG: SRPBCC domain-containing protein [Mariniblastus sp.]
MDFDNAAGAEYRIVKNADRDGQPARIVSVARTHETDANDLWDAVANPKRLPCWFLPITGDLKLGGRYQLEGHASGKITQCVPQEFMEMTWECGDNLSWVSIRLTPDGEGTRMTLEHTMLKDEASETHWKKYGPGATGVGWDLGFAGLGLHLANGNATIDQQDTQAWMASEHGKQFIRESAKAWGEAHIAAGESAPTAVEMAEQTAKAYTGEE